VDDEAAICKILGIKLRVSGYDVITAHALLPVLGNFFRSRLWNHFWGRLPLRPPRHVSPPMPVP
jgi:hypothetical protein